MKIKQFFINNKSKIKKVFSIFLIVLLFLFYSYTTFACGYNVKTALDDSNKKELVNRKNALSSNVNTNMSTMVTNIVSSSNSDGQLVLILHIDSFNLGYYSDELEFELEYTLVTRFYYSNNAYIEQYHSNLFGYFYSQGQFDTISNVELSFYPNVVISEGGFDDSILHPSFDFLWECDVEVLNEEDVIIQANGPLNFSFTFAPTIPNQSQEIAESLIDFFTALDDYGLTNMTFNNSISFNLDVYDHYYNNGYQAGKKEQEDYYEDLILPAVKIEYEEIGYDKGYIAGKNDALNSGSGVALFDAFTLIGKGFEVWNPILNTQVLPGLTIGVFIAIPIVIAVVIIVIKLLQR